MSKAWVFGDDIDTDQLAPGRFMKAPMSELARHCLELVDPAFASAVRPGDIVVGGRNFGMGSSREQAVQALRQLGVAAVLARSFAGIFFRNAYNLGLLALVSEQIDRVRPGDDLVVDPRAGRISNLTTGETIACSLVPDHLMALVEAGGLVPLLEKRFRNAKETA